MTNLQLILVLYFCAAGIYTYLCFRPDQLDEDFEDWCKRHENDSDYLSKRNELYSYLCEFESEPIMPLVSLLFGWLIAPKLLYNLCIRFYEDTFKKEKND